LQPEENPEWGRQLFFIYSANDTEKQTLHRRITPSDGPIPKDCDIDFEIINPFSLPPNSELFWLARNQGREAENINDLGYIAGVASPRTSAQRHRTPRHLRKACFCVWGVVE